MSTTSPAARTWRQDFYRVCFRFVPQLIISLMFWWAMFSMFIKVIEIIISLVTVEPTLVRS